MEENCYCGRNNQTKVCKKLDRGCLNFAQCPKTSKTYKFE